MSSFWIIDGTIQTNSVTIGYSASGASLPYTWTQISSVDEEGNATAYYQYSYSDLYYNLVFSDGTSFHGTTGTKTFSNLTAGALNDIGLQIIAYCTQTTTYFARLTDANDNPVWENSVVGQGIYQITDKETLSLSIYTRPSTFNLYNFKKNKYIHTQLTIEVITKWCEQCGKYLSWKYQGDHYRDAMRLIPNSKDPITAEWFNDCSEICGAGIVVEKDKTQITTELFEKLGKAIS